MQKRSIEYQYFDAVGRGNIRDVIRLLDSNPELISEQKPDRNALILAASCGHMDIVKLLHSRGIDVNEMHPEHGYSALHKSCQSGYLNICLWLLETGANVNSGVEVDKPTPLVYAVIDGYEEIVHRLVEHGADVNASYFATTLNIRQNPMDLAISFCRGSIAQYLRVHGAKSTSELGGLSRG